MLDVGSYVTANVRLLRPLGAGGMGRVWLAQHEGLHSEVVVKFLSEALEGDAEAMERFSREAAAASRVKSPHVVQMLDHGVTAEGQPYIVMEHLEGRDLGQWLDSHGKLPIPSIREIVVQLSRALEKAHQSGIVHRDIKPENIFLCDAGDGALFVKLLDFGIAKGASTLNGRGTATGNVMGSPFYMSPEQLTGARDLGPPTDLWSVGIVLFELLTGKRPYEAETLGALALMVHQETFPDVLAWDPTLPPTLRPFFARACAKRPADRFSRASELAEAFTAASQGLEFTAPRSGPASGPLGSIPAPSLVPSSSPIAFQGTGSSRGEIALARTEATTDGSLGVARNASTMPPRSVFPVWIPVVALVALLAAGGLFWAVRKGPSVTSVATTSLASASAPAVSATATTIAPVATALADLPIPSIPSPAVLPSAPTTSSPPGETPDRKTTGASKHGSVPIRRPVATGTPTSNSPNVY
jgi:serine/threonine-protein kinase